MGSLLDKVNLGDFEISALDTSEIDRVSNWFPKGGVIDLNTAEEGMILSLHAQNICQEHIIQIDIWIGYKESDKSRAWLNAIAKAKENGCKTIKDKEWYAQADEAYIDACNELTLAKAAKRYFENKASSFSGWHYAFKTFLNRDYSLEKLANLQAGAYNIGSPGGRSEGPENDEWSDSDDDAWK